VYTLSRTLVVTRISVTLFELDFSKLDLVADFLPCLLFSRTHLVSEVLPLHTASTSSS
jgi:hypothetical protein